MVSALMASDKQSLTTENVSSSMASSVPSSVYRRKELPGRFELGTEAWRNEAVSFLNRENAKIKKSIFRDDVEGVSAGIGDIPFTMCELLKNAPPHLGFNDNTSCFSLSYDGKTFTATDQPNPDADYKVTGDYQAALSAAQIVGFAEPARRDMAMNILGNLFGSAALSVEGQLKNPGAAELITKMHDFLARRTVENPDLAHRAERLGVVDHIKQLDEKGYTIIENVIPDDVAEAIRNEVLRLSATMPTKTVPSLLQHGRLFEDLILNPATMALIDSALGRGAILGYFLGSQRGPGKGVIGMHSDDAFPHPFPEWPMTVNCLYALDDWSSAESGPTWVVPGSHKMRRQSGSRDDQSGGMPIVMPKGSALIFNGSVWHWQGDRSDPGLRVTINAHYFRSFVRPHEPFVRDERLIYQNPPRLQELLGMDDGWDNGDFKGKEFKRFDYMTALNRFNDASRAVLFA